jgi:hypothetical protein
MPRSALTLPICLALLAASILSASQRAGDPNPHAYFEQLSARAERHVALSLRDQAQIDLYTQGARPDRPVPNAFVTYDPFADKYPQKQDAAKVRILENEVSLRAQVFLPIDVVGGNALITWDGWWGREYATGGLDGHKAFQISSPWDKSERLFEVRTASFGFGGGVGLVDARSYGIDGVPHGYLDRLEPMIDAGEYAAHRGRPMILPETWTRFWVFWESVPNGLDRWSLWIADATRGPIQLYDRAPMDAKDETLTRMRLEYNSSQNSRTGGLLTSYVRNYVVLRNVTGPTRFLQRPVPGALADLGTSPDLSAPRNVRIVR